MIANVQRRNGTAAFTMIEMVVVLMLMMIIIGVASSFYFGGFDNTPEIQKPADALSRMVKMASRAAVVQGHPIIIAFDKKGFGFVGGVASGADAHYSISKEMKISVQRWNGGKSFISAENLNWTFYPTGICDALRFRFNSPDGVAEVAYNPLTGSVSDQMIILK